MLGKVPIINTFNSFVKKKEEMKQENAALTSTLDKTKQKLENCQQKKVQKQDCV